MKKKDAVKRHRHKYALCELYIDSVKPDSEPFKQGEEIELPEIEINDYFDIYVCVNGACGHIQDVRFRKRRHEEGK